MAIKKETDPLPSWVIKIVVIIIVVLGTVWLSSKIDGYKQKVQLQNVEIKNKSETVKQLETKLEKANSDLNAELESKESNSKKLQEAEQKKLEYEQELQKTKEQLQAKLNSKKNTAYAGAPVPADKQNLMSQAGIPASDWVYVDSIVSRESGWDHLVHNKSGSSAYGICQALPGSKMATAGADWKTNPVTQLRWCNSYAHSRYGSWQKAYNFWNAKHWW